MKSLKIWLVLFSIGFLQCGKSSDYSQGPTSSGGEVRIHLLSVVYQPDKGAVLIQWDQTGDAGKGKFHIQRKEGNGDFADIGQKVADSSGSDAGVFSFLDTEALAGELMSYRVVLRLEDKQALSNVLKTQMPGARLLDVGLNPERAVVRVRWTPDMEQGVAYEVVRRIGEETEAVVHRTGDVGEEEFVDGPIVGNEVHSYWIRTLTQGGAKLESRSQEIGLYLASYATQFTIIPGKSVRLALDNYGPNTTRPLFCVVEAGRVTMHRKTFYPPESRVFPPGRPPTFDEASIYLNEEPALVPASISVAGPSLPVIWNPVSLRLDPLRSGNTFVAGIDPQTQAVHIKLFNTYSSGWSFQFKSSYAWVSSPPDWHVDSTNRIAITQEFVKRYDLNKYNHWRLYVVAGGTLKIFNIFQFRDVPPRAEIVEVWSEPIQATTPPYDLLFWKNALWMSFPKEHRLVKAQIDFGSEEPQHITYRDIPLMDGMQPSALTVNFSGQLCVLDMHNSKIWMLNQEGDPITHIEVKGPGFMQDGRLNGDLVAGLEELQDVLYVVKPSGIMTILKTEMP